MFHLPGHSNWLEDENQVRLAKSTPGILLEPLGNRYPLFSGMVPSDGNNATEKLAKHTANPERTAEARDAKRSKSDGQLPDNTVWAPRSSQPVKVPSSVYPKADAWIFWGKRQNIMKYPNSLKMFIKHLNAPDTILGAGEGKGTV